MSTCVPRCTHQTPNYTAASQREPSSWASALPSNPARLAAMLHNFGRVVATAALAAAVPHHQITALLDRHASGDWGELDAEDKTANDEAARTGDGRLLSSYDTPDYGKIWIITNDIRGEGDGPVTTVLFHDDY